MRRPRYEKLHRGLERLMISAAQAGDSQAMQRLINANVPLIWREVRRFTPKQDYDDGWQVACVGFMEGVMKFDGNAKNRLFSYARWYMKKELSIAAKACRLRAMKEVLTDFPASDLNDQYGKRPLEPADAPRKKVDVLAMRTAAETSVRVLNRRELRTVVDRADGKTLDEVGLVLRVSRERARQIQAEAISKIRRSLRLRRAS